MIFLFLFFYLVFLKGFRITLGTIFMTFCSPPSAVTSAISTKIISPSHLSASPHFYLLHLLLSIHFRRVVFFSFLFDPSRPSFLIS